MRNIQANVHSTCKKYSKRVKVNGHEMLALIDTGRDICLLRSDKYIRLGSPRLHLKEIRFRGISSNDNTTLGEFNTDITVAVILILF